VDLDAAVVVNEAQFSKFVHEKTYAGPGRADHLRQRLLADFRDHRLRFVFLAKVRQQQEQTSKSFLTRIEQLIDEVCVDADGPAKKMRYEQLGECWLLMGHEENRRFFQPHDDGLRHRRGCSYALCLPGQTSLTEEFVRTQNCDDSFFAQLRNDGDLYLASLDKTAFAGSPCEKTISFWIE